MRLYLAMVRLRISQPFTSSHVTHMVHAFAYVLQGVMKPLYKLQEFTLEVLYL